jgi:hypothetical protein
MIVDAYIRKQTREWTERVIKAYARFETTPARQTRCGGCGTLFAEHPFEAYAECVQQLLSAEPAA